MNVHMYKKFAYIMSLIAYLIGVCGYWCIYTQPYAHIRVKMMYSSTNHDLREKLPNNTYLQPLT